MRTKVEEDIEKNYSKQAFINRLRRLADAIEESEPFLIQVGGRRVRVPVSAITSIEFEKDSSVRELEFQLKW